MKVELVNLTKMRLPKAAIIKRSKRVFTVLEKLGMWPKKNYPVYLVFIGKNESQRINQTFLGKNRPTNILSFDYGDFGEILLTPYVVEKEALKLGVTVLGRIGSLVGHGALHLAGVHHERSRQAAGRFDRVERRVAEMTEGRGVEIDDYR